MDRVSSAAAALLTAVAGLTIVNLAHAQSSIDGVLCTEGGQYVICTPAEVIEAGDGATLSSRTPLVESGSGAPGTGSAASRDDHVHPAGGGGGGTTTPLSDATPLVESGSGAPGSASAASRGDHVHPAHATPLSAYGPVGTPGQCAKADAARTGLSYGDCGSPRTLSTFDPRPDGPVAPGTRTDVSRADHVHPASPSALPDVAGHAKDVLSVDAGGTDAEWISPTTVILEGAGITSGDAGKIITANSSGNGIALETPHDAVLDGLPSITGQGGRLLGVNTGATGLVWTDASGASGTFELDPVGDAIPYASARANVGNVAYGTLPDVLVVEIDHGRLSPTNSTGHETQLVRKRELTEQGGVVLNIAGVASAYLQLTATGSSNSSRIQAAWNGINSGSAQIYRVRVGGQGGSNPPIPEPTAAGTLRHLRVNAAGAAYELAVPPPDLTSSVAANLARIESVEDLTVDIDDDVADRVWQLANVAAEGGMEAVQALPSSPANAATVYGAADGVNTIDVADGASQVILFRIQKDRSRTTTRIDVPRGWNLSGTTYIGGIGGNVYGNWKYYGITVTRGAGAQAGSALFQVQDDVYLWRGQTLYDQAQGAPDDAQIGEAAFENPPSGLSDQQKAAVRSAIGASTGAAALSDSDPRPLGPVAAGAGTKASRDDHVHPLLGFTGLTDTPGTYSGQGGRIVAVNAGATALEFVPKPSGGADLPTPTAATALEHLRVNAAGSAYELADPPPDLTEALEAVEADGDATERAQDYFAARAVLSAGAAPWIAPTSVSAAALTSSRQPLDLATARGVHVWNLTESGGVSEPYVTVRLPSSAFPTRARVVYRTAGTRARTSYEPIAGWTELGSSSDGRYDYYRHPDDRRFAASGSTLSLELTGAPLVIPSLAGHAADCLKVNAAATALGWSSCFDGHLNPPIPGPTAAAALKHLRVNAAGAAYELADPPPDLSGEVDDNESAIEHLNAVTSDLIAGVPPTGWANATSASAGGVAMLAAIPTLATARAAAYATSVGSVAGGRFVVIRIPATTSVVRARYIVSGVGAARRGETFLASGLLLLGTSSDGAFKYYADGDREPLNAAATGVQVQLTGAAHVGTSEYEGLPTRVKGWAIKGSGLPVPVESLPFATPWAKLFEGAESNVPGGSELNISITSTATEAEGFLAAQRDTAGLGPYRQFMFQMAWNIGDGENEELVQVQAMLPGVPLEGSVAQANQPVSYRGAMSSLTTICSVTLRASRTAVNFATSGCVEDWGNRGAQGNVSLYWKLWGRR